MLRHLVRLSTTTITTNQQQFGYRSIRHFSQSTAINEPKTSIHTNQRFTLLGAPGSGKGTYGKFLSQHYGIPIISVGDLVRDEIKQNTELGKMFKEYSDSGRLVPDEVITKLLFTRLCKEDMQHGYILDGYPRTQNQLALLFSPDGIPVQPPSFAIKINVPNEVILAKTLGRRGCGDCGKGYNLANVDINNGEIYMPAILPRQENVCDDCNGPLTQRVDDTEEIVHERLRIYQQMEDQIVPFFKDCGCLLNWNMKLGIADVPKLLVQTDDFITSLKKH